MNPDLELTRHLEINLYVLSNGIEDRPRFASCSCPARKEVESLIPEEGDHDIEILEGHVVKAFRPQALTRVPKHIQCGQGTAGDKTRRREARRSRLDPTTAEVASNSLGHG